MYNYAIMASVILYYPDDRIISNISSYINGCQSLIVIDNSPNVNVHINRRIAALSSKIKIVENRENQGVAYALNQAIDVAFQDGCDWLLTMDQDSHFTSFEHYLKCIHKYPTKNDVAIFAPNIGSEANGKCCQHEERDIVITSGNLINLKHIKKIGYFEAKLFIDEIDHDFCLRCIEYGFKIIHFNHVQLNHKIGDKKEHTSLIFRKKNLR